MANNKDVDKILQNLKKPDNTSTLSHSSTMTSDQLKRIIAEETAKKEGKTTQPQKSGAVNAVPETATNTKATQQASQVENEFLSKLATALKENPAVADLVEEVDESISENDKNKNKVNVTAASYVDEKFVDFFTTTVAVPKSPSTAEILIKRRTKGFFRKKYITDSLTLSIPQEEVDKRQQKVAKPTTAELARDIISKAAADTAQEKETPAKADKAVYKPQNDTAVVDIPQEEEKKSLFGRKKKQQEAVADDLPLVKRYKEYAEADEQTGEADSYIPQEEQEQPKRKGFFGALSRMAEKYDELEDEIEEEIEEEIDELEEKAEKAGRKLGSFFRKDRFIKDDFVDEDTDEDDYADDTEYDESESDTDIPSKPDFSALKTQQPVVEQPRDAESILKALKAKKQTQATVVATAAAATVAPIMVTPHTSDYSDNAVQETADSIAETEQHNDTQTAGFEQAIEHTGYMPSQLEEEEEREILVVPKTEQDKKVKRITGDITQMFAASGLLKDETEEVVIEEDEEEEEEIFEIEEYSLENEYITHQFSDDPKEILEELKNFKSTLAIRMGLAVVVALVLLYFNFGAAGVLPLPEFIAADAQPMMFYLVNLIFFAIAAVGFLPTLANGVTGFAKAPTQDSFVVVPAFWCFVQLVVAIITHENIVPSQVTIFAAFTVMAFGFNALGKFISANTILTNLALADVPEGINAGYIVKDMEDVKRLARTLEEKNPEILVSRKTGYISNFISGGFSTHKSEHNSKLLAIITAVVTVICFVTGYVVSKNWSDAVFAAAGAGVLMLPLSHSLISSVPSSLMQKALTQVGTLVNGWQGIYQLCDATHVSFDAKHLFPKGCVVLHGIKTFEKERLDLAILYAASIAIEHVDNLRNVFMTVIDGKMDMLYPMESCEYKVGQGYVAWIENNRVIMGNRSIMEEYEIALPPISMETAYLSEGKKPIYLSVNGKLFGMFVVSYHADEAVKDNLLNLIESGKCVILQSNDFNVDSQLLELVYGLPQDTVQVLNKNETALLLNYTAYAENTDSAMAHLDSLHSLSAGFFGADKAKRAASTCSLIQIISIITGAVLAVMFTFSQTLWSIPVTSVLLLGLGWLGLSLIRAVATKYY